MYVGTLNNNTWSQYIELYKVQSPDRMPPPVPKNSIFVLEGERLLGGCILYPGDVYMLVEHFVLNPELGVSQMAKVGELIARVAAGFGSVSGKLPFVCSPLGIGDTLTKVGFEERVGFKTWVFLPGRPPPGEPAAGPCQSACKGHPCALPTGHNDVHTDGHGLSWVTEVQDAEAGEYLEPRGTLRDATDAPYPEPPPVEPEEPEEEPLPGYPPRPEPRKPQGRKCSVCGETGHNKRSCPVAD